MKSHSAADARPNQLQKRILPALFHLRCPSQSHQRSARGRTRLTTVTSTQQRLQQHQQQACTLREHSTAAVGFHFGGRPHKRKYCFVLTSLVLGGLHQRSGVTAAGTVAAGQQRLRRACCPLCVLSYSLLCALLRTRLLLMGMSVGREF